MIKREVLVERVLSRACEITGTFLPYRTPEQYEQQEREKRVRLTERVGHLMLAEGTVQNHTYNGLQNRANAMLDLMPGRSHEIVATTSLVDEHLADGRAESDAVALGHELLDITRELHHES